jgi:hypothetical protein
MSRLLAISEIRCDIIEGPGGNMILGFLGLSLAVLFFVLYRSGILEDLPGILGGDPDDRPYRPDPEEERRLEVYKDFFEDDSNNE